MSQRRNLMDRRGPNAIWRRAGLLGVILLAGCGEKSANQAPAAAAPPPAVTVITTQLADITPTFGFNGRVVAEDKVELRARVDGFLQQRLFKEGADVKVGELLFVIEKDHLSGGGRAAPGRARERRGQPDQHRGRAPARRGTGQEQEHPPGRGRPAARRRPDGGRQDPGGAGGAQAGRDQPRLHRHLRAHRRPDRPRQRQRRQSGRPRQRRARDHRQPGPDLRDLPGQPAPAARVPAGTERQRASAGGQGRPAGRHALPASGQPQLPRRPGRSGHRHGHGAGDPAQPRPRPGRRRVREREGRGGHARAPDRDPAGGAPGRPGGPLRAGRRRR